MLELMTYIDYDNGQGLDQSTMIMVKDPTAFAVGLQQPERDGVRFTCPD